MKNWKSRTKKKFEGVCGGSIVLNGSLLVYRVYDKGFPSHNSKFFTLDLRKKGADETFLTGDWIVAQGFSVKQVFDNLRKEIKDNKWNTLNEN